MLSKQKDRPSIKNILVSSIFTTGFMWLAYIIVLRLTGVHPSAYLGYGFLTGSFFSSVFGSYYKPLISRRKDGKVTS